LAVRTLAAAVRARRFYGREFVDQFLFVVRTCWLPLLVCSLAASYGVLGLESGAVFSVLGAEERMGALVGRFGSSQVAPLVSATVIGGVAGLAMCVDLAAREVRDELDALDVLGVDLVKSLVVPRFLALVLATPLFAVLAQQFCVAGGLLAAVTFDVPPGEFVNTLLNSSPGPLGLLFMILKACLFGAVIAVVACFKGLSVSPGPEGIGRAVSQAAVVSVIGVFALNYLVSYLFAGLTPDLNIVK
jgi:phospholipid/cholesterol/gamma-HCH transport system permease protein